MKQEDWTRVDRIKGTQSLAVSRLVGLEGVLRAAGTLINGSVKVTQCPIANEFNCRVVHVEDHSAQNH